MRERGAGARAGRDVRAGAALLLAVVAVAAAAPWIASERPWIARGPDGWVLPSRSAAADGTAALEPVLGAPVPYDPDRIRLGEALRPPSRQHWLGTDSLGRDVAARLIHGARVSVAVGLLSAGIALLVGVPIGLLAGLARGPVDAVVMRLIEAVLCFPTLLLLLAVLTAAPAWLGAFGDTMRISVVLAAVGWVPVARYLRGEVLRVVASDVVASARACGAGPVRIALRHVLPASLAPVVVTAAFAVAAAVVVESSLSFLGLGIRPPTATWGGLLADARTHVSTAWWMVVFPGAALFVTLLACNLLGEGVRATLAPGGGRR